MLSPKKVIGTGTIGTPSRHLLVSSPFLYQALERLDEFPGNITSVALDGEILVHPHRLEVWPVRSIVASSDGDVLADKDMRIALVCCGWHRDSLHK